MVDQSQSQYKALDEMTRSQVISETLITNTPHCAEVKSEYASLNPSRRCWEIPKKNVTLKEVVGKGAFGQVAKATATGLHESPNETLIAVKMLKGINCFIGSFVGTIQRGFSFLVCLTFIAVSISIGIPLLRHFTI